MKRSTIVSCVAMVFAVFSPLPGQEPLAFNIGAAEFDADEELDREDPLALRFNVAPETSLGLVPDFSVAALGQDGSEKKKSFFGLKLGAFWGTDDLHDLDEFFYSELVFGRYLIGEFLALEGDIGFFYDDDDVGPFDFTLWGIPLFANARADINILFLDLYGGAGIGGIYVNAEVDSPFGDDNDDDFVVAGDIFLGFLVNLGSLYAGVEGKYIVTDKTDLGFDFEGIAVTANVGLRF